MRARMLFVSVCLLVASGASAQPQPQFQPPPQPPLGPSPGVPKGPVPILQPPAGSVSLPAVPREKSADELLTEIEQLRAQKAELDKKEQELTAALRKKLDAQAERLKKLGLAPKESDRVGRIIIEGNAAKNEKKILDLLGFRPGQVLVYPALEEARARLEKAGFLGSSVEVVPGGAGSNLKDVRVQMLDPDNLAPHVPGPALPPPPRP